MKRASNAAVYRRHKSLISPGFRAAKSVAMTCR